jgi:predicted DNA-binding transcriptional regulator AlpA
MELLNEAATLALSGLPRSTLHRYVATDKFPAPRKPDGWHLVWDKGEVADWALARAVVKDAANFKTIPALDLAAMARSIDPSLANRLFPSATAVLRGAA